MPVELAFSLNDILTNPLAMFALFGVGAMAAGIIGLVILRKILHAAAEQRQTFTTVLLLVLLPKISSEQKAGTGGGADMRLEQIQEKIGMMDSLLAALASIKSEKGLMVWLRGRQEIMSLEMVINRGQIAFYISTPVKYKSMIEDQVVAQFPDAVVETVADYNIFSPKSIIHGKVLGFQREYFFPIKTYRKLESDPLNGLVNALGQVDDKDGAAIQILFYSAPKDWHKLGPKVASKMQQGRNITDAIKEAKGGILNSARKEMKEFAKAGKTGQMTNEQKPYSLSPMEQEIVKGLEEKSAKPGVYATIRIVAASENENRVSTYLNNICNAFAQFNMVQFGNAFEIISPKPRILANDFIYRNIDRQHQALLNSEELASLFHFPLPSVTEHPKIHWLEARQAPPPLELPAEGVVIGESAYRGVKKVIRMTEKDRMRHIYAIGKSGTGKSHFMTNVIIQDIANGAGVCVMDPHGDLANGILPYIPKERAEDVIYFNPADVDRPMGLNMLEFEREEQKTFVINELMNIFDKLYDLRSTGGPMFEQYFRNAVQLLMEDVESGSTIMEVPKVLADEGYRAYKLSKCKNPTVKNFWEKEAQKAGGEASLANMVPYITSKLTQFISNDYMRPIIAQQKSAFSFREAMDSGKILLCNLSKGKIGDMNSDLLGMIVVGKILGGALARVDTPDDQRRPFYLFIDEFQNYLTEGISIILSEARKYNLGLFIAHQFIGQLVKNNDTRIRDAIFGNVGTVVCYRIGVDDAETLAKQFAPVFSEYDVINVPARTVFIKMLIHGQEPPAFNMKIPARDAPKHPEIAEALVELSRLKYGRDRDIIESEIRERATAEY